MISSMRLSSISSLVGTNQNTCIIQLNYTMKNMIRWKTFFFKHFFAVFYAIIHKDGRVSYDVSILVFGLSQVMLSFYYY